MSIIQKIKTFLHDDPLIRRVLRNSGHLFSSNVVSAVLSVVQGILVARMLGEFDFGLVFAIIIPFVSNVNRLLSFRMSEVVVKYMGEALAHGDKERAAIIVKGIGLTEAFTSILAYLVLLVVSAWGAQTFAKDVSTAYLFQFYGIFLLANLVYETSVGVLQTTNKFDQVARANFYQSIVLTILIVIVFIGDLGVLGVLIAYLIGKTIASVLVCFSATRELKEKLGSGWINTPLKQIADWKNILFFALNTNLNGTINLFARDNIPLYLAPILTNSELGYFSLASRLINLIMLPIEPFIWPTYAEITRTIAQRQWLTTRKLLKQVSTLAGTWTLLAGGALAAVGWWLIPFLYGSNFAPTYPCLLIFLVGYGFANILNWNRPLLLALGHPTYPLMVAALTGAIEIICIFIFVPRGGYLMGAAIFSTYLVISIGWNVLRGLTLIKRAEATA